MRRTLFAVLSTISIAFSSIETQEIRRDSIVARIRRGVQLRGVLRQGAQPLLYGKVDSIQGDTIAVRISSDSVTRLTFDDLATLEIYERSTTAQRLSQVFFGIGVAGGAALYLTWCAQNRHECNRVDEDTDPSDEDGDGDPYNDGGMPMAVFVPLSTGFVLGALAQALFPPHWEPVQLPVRVGVAPTRRGLMLYASVSTSLLGR